MECVSGRIVSQDIFNDSEFTGKSFVVCRPETHPSLKGPSGSYWARSSLAPPPWRRCHPGWRGSGFRSPPLSSDQTCSGTYWASPHLSASPARLWTERTWTLFNLHTIQIKLDSAEITSSTSLTNHLKHNIYISAIIKWCNKSHLHHFFFPSNNSFFKSYIFLNILLKYERIHLLIF